VTAEKLGAAFAALGLLLSCGRGGTGAAALSGAAPEPPAPTFASASAASGMVSSTASVSAAPVGLPPALGVLVQVDEPAMGTKLHFVAYTTDALSEEAIRTAMHHAAEEVRRVEGIMTTWRDDSELSAINRGAGKPVSVGPEAYEVIERSLWAGKISGGTFDITFHTMGGLWKFGDAEDAVPKAPDPREVTRLRKLVDYRLIKLDPKTRSVTIPEGRKIDLGGIAKGYAVDCASRVLSKAGLVNFLAQAGGDLYGAGKKPDGSHWVSGIQDPRGPDGAYFATIELENRAFSTAGDYARAYLVDGKRYHHIIDPRTGYPATASRSVTVWAPDAFVADAVDDGVFILGPKKGLELVESLDGVGAVIVDKDNKVWVSKRLEGKVKILRPPTDGL